MHNVVAEPPEAIQTSADHADIALDGADFSFAGNDVNLSGKPSQGTAINCVDRFVPFPVPVSVR